MKGFIVLAVLFLVSVVFEETQATTCAYSCTKSVRYRQSCGFWGWTGWSKCTKYRSKFSTCYRSCVHGNWSGWKTSLESCSKSCGGGTQKVLKTRTCTNPRPSNGGKYCPGSSKSTTTQSCNTQNCPVDGNWSLWKTSIGDCSKACGGGTQRVVKSRTCTKPPPSNGGRGCPGSSTSTTTKSCNTQNCPVDGMWSGWKTSIGDCSKACGGGTQRVVKSRTCTNPPPSNGGRGCPGSSTSTTTKSCNTQSCPVNGGWSEFTLSNTGDCSVTCGGGAKILTYSRTCTNPLPQYGGRDCEGEDTKTEEEVCNENPCPVNGGWSEFTAWEDFIECDVLCGGGSKGQSRSRTCTNPAPAYGGLDCDGDQVEQRIVQCNTDACGDKCPIREITFIAHPDNKRKFYQCAQGVARLQECALGTHWSQESLVCVNDEVETD